MKNIICFLFTLLISSISYGQCTDCTSFEEALKAPAGVKTLKINPWQHETTLEELPADIGLLENLEILYLSDHTFESVPKEIGNLKKLKELSFAGCSITSLPDEIFELNNLKEIILLNTELAEKYKTALKKRFSKEMPRTKVLMN